MIERHAYNIALQARLRSYSPYSRFAVGAALKAKGNSHIFGGCNVENASFGATICAERAALTAMVSQIGAPRLELIVVVTDSEPPFTPPCGICLQVLVEFCDVGCPLLLGNLHGIQERLTIGEIIARPFTSFAPVDGASGER